MQADSETTEEFLERLVRERRRETIGYAILTGIPAAFLIATFISDWLFGAKPLWVQALIWVNRFVFVCYSVVLIFLGTKRGKFLDRLVFGRRRELSEELKAELAQHEFAQKALDKLTRPVRWALLVSVALAVGLLLEWRDGRLDLASPLGIALGVLLLIGGLMLWAMQRIGKHFYESQRR